MSASQAQVEAGEAELQEHYLDWTAQSLTEMRALQSKLPTRQESAGEITHAMHRIVHDLKGMGGSFGYPLMSRIGASLCAYLSGLPADDYPAEDVVAAHLRAMEVVLGNRIAGDGGDAGNRLVSHLTSLDGAAAP